MIGVPQDRLDALYAETDDPWNFRTSAYEATKYAATRAALLRPHYVSALEVGCGNGELARRLAPLCGHYIGVDAVESALDAARRAAPGASFVRGFLPCELPAGDHDLIVLSEILYFLDEASLKGLAAQIGRRWPAGEVLAVTWLGPSGNQLEGADALDYFARSLPPLYTQTIVAKAASYRIDRFVGS